MHKNREDKSNWRKRPSLVNGRNRKAEGETRTRRIVLISLHAWIGRVVLTKYGYASTRWNSVSLGCVALFFHCFSHPEVKPPRIYSTRILSVRVVAIFSLVHHRPRIAVIARRRSATRSPRNSWTDKDTGLIRPVYRLVYRLLCSAAS